MEYMGYGIKWREMIHKCLSGLKLAVLINSSPSKEFSEGWIIRQGDPLSPFLFDTAVEGLSVLFSHAASVYLFLGLQLRTGDYLSLCSMLMIHWVFFLPPSLSSLKVVKQFLRWFYLCSGLQINFFIKPHLLE